MRVNRALMAVTLVLTFAVGVLTSSIQRGAVGKRVIWIYLYPADDAESTRPLSQRASRENVLALVPVEREVSVATPARGALEALIAGPTEEEKKRGLLAPYTDGLSIAGLTIINGVARVSFTSSCADCPRWPGDLAVWRFTEAITRTLKQFPNVKRVMICLDGYEDFGDATDSRNKKC